MDTRPIRPHTLIAPLLIGIFSLLGLCAVLALAFLPNENAAVVPTRTPTPFTYQFLATETSIPIPPTETAETAETAETSEVQVRVAPTGTFETSRVTLQAAGTTPSLIVTEHNVTSPARSSTPSTPVGTITLDPIFGNDPPLLAGIYDETDVGFTYIGIWDTQENVDAYLESIVVSEAVGDYVAFSFAGIQISVGYISSGNAGEITINIDGSELTIRQNAGDVWNSEELPSGEHYVLITHTAGGPINLDYVEVIE